MTYSVVTVVGLKLRRRDPILGSDQGAVLPLHMSLAVCINFSLQQCDCYLRAIFYRYQSFKFIMLSTILKLFLTFQICNLSINARKHPKHVNLRTTNMYNNILIAHFWTKRSAKKLEKVELSWKEQKIQQKKSFLKT